MGNKKIHEYIVKGFTMDDDRDQDILKNFYKESVTSEAVKETFIKK